MYITAVDKEKCTGCGTCVKKCPTEATFLNDDNKAERKEELCIGCGVCAYFCPEEAIFLVEKPRIVRIPPHRRK
jgi:ferredoxin